LDRGEVVEKDKLGKPSLAMGIAFDITDSKNMTHWKIKFITWINND
jgi:hypothetical protein